MAISRLSPENITDHLIRAELYRDIRAGAAKRDPDWVEYEIQPDERLRADLVAYRHYGIEGLEWLVLILAEQDDRRGELPVGESIWMPPIVWVRQRIKYWTDFEAAQG